MKKYQFVLIWFFISVSMFGQDAISGSNLNNLISKAKTAFQDDVQVEAVVNGIIDNPDLYNNLWEQFIKQASLNNGTTWKFLNDLNIKFKNFQNTENSFTSLGFTYDFDFNYAKSIESGHNSISHSFGLTAKGNVAFNKKLNTSNLIETNINYDFTYYSGGVVENSDTAIFTKLGDIRAKLAKIKDQHSKEALSLLDEYGKFCILSTQYYFGISPKFGFESNQDFTKKQFTPGVTIDLGVKAWNKKDLLAQLNILDYPFAILRLITGIDDNFTPYGSTLPIAEFTFNYVIPTNDSTRKSLTGNINPFPRIKFETGFRTIISRIEKENIFFSTDFRYYYEINAPQAIKDAKVNNQLYVVAALQSTSGLYVSYAYGKLPFDAKNDEVYSIGFNCKLF